MAEKESLLEKLLTEKDEEIDRLKTEQDHAKGIDKWYWQQNLLLVEENKKLTEQLAQEKKQKEQLSDKLKSAETDLQIERDAKNFIQQKLNQEKSTNSNFQNQINQLTQDKN